MKTSTVLFTLTLAITAFCTPAVLQPKDQGSDGDIDGGVQADGGLQATGLGSHEIGPEIGEPIDWDLGDVDGSTETDPYLEVMPHSTDDGDDTDPEVQVIPFDDDPSVGEDGPTLGDDDGSDGTATIQIEPLGVEATAAAEAGLGSVHVPPFVNPLLPPLHPTVRTSTTTKAAKPTTKKPKTTSKKTKTTTKAAKPTTKSASKSKAGHPITRSSSIKSKAGHPITRSSSTESKAGPPITKSSTHKTKVGHPITKSATTKHAACTTTTTETLARLTKYPYYKACVFDGTERIYPGTTTKVTHINCHGCSKIVKEYKPSFIHCPAETITATVTEKKLFTTTQIICKPSQTK